jgi:signal transduction histidine kinase
MVEQIESSMSQIATLNEILEQRVAERTQKLQETNRELSETLRQLRTTQRQLVKLEKEALEVQMAGGFAHEMRNALAGAVIMLDTVFREGQTIAEETMGILQEIFTMFHSQIAPHDKASLIEGFAAVERNEQQVDEVLRRVEQYVQAALQTTNLILEYAKIGKAKTGNEYVNLNDLCEDILAEHRQTFQQDHIQAALTGKVFHPIKGWKNHFHAIINNLVANARDELVNIPNRNRMIEIGLSEEDHVQIVTVKDNANGISEENQQGIFEPFFYTKPDSGLGLGLSFVSKLVPMYRGTIDVTSDIGKGTIFRVTFPIEEEFHAE